MRKEPNRLREEDRLAVTRNRLWHHRADPSPWIQRRSLINQDQGNWFLGTYLLNILFFTLTTRVGVVVVVVVVVVPVTVVVGVVVVVVPVTVVVGVVVVEDG